MTRLSCGVDDLGAVHADWQDRSMATALSNAQQPVFRPGPVPIRIGNLIVDPPVLQAPMAGFTNFAFRQIVREFGGVGLIATEMVQKPLKIARARP